MILVVIALVLGTVASSAWLAFRGWRRSDLAIDRTRLVIPVSSPYRVPGRVKPKRGF